MAKLDVLYNNFSSGEISPIVAARADYERYMRAAKALINWEVLLQGGVQSRRGTRYAWTAKYGDKTTILRRFEPEDSVSYILEIGDLYFRFGLNKARLESPPGTPVEVVTPYVHTHLRQLRTAQANDVMILAHAAYAPPPPVAVDGNDLLLCPGVVSPPADV